MRFSLLSLAAAIILPAFAAPSARSPPDGCTQDTRFGSVEAVPSNSLNPGDGITVHADFSCPLYLGVVPKYIDYYVKAINSSVGDFTPVLLGRREFHQSLNTPPIDTFSAAFPNAYYYNGSTYAITVEATYPVNGTSNVPFYTVGEAVSSPITINGFHQ